MKKPTEINFYPLDIKKDDDGGMWFRLPEWIVRAYKLKKYGTNMGKVKFVIKSENRAMFEYQGEQNGGHEYFKRNWSAKLRRERRKQLNDVKKENGE
jgi:hypothetical protein